MLLLCLTHNLLVKLLTNYPTQICVGVRRMAIIRTFPPFLTAASIVTDVVLEEELVPLQLVPLQLVVTLQIVICSIRCRDDLLDGVIHNKLQVTR